MLRRAYIEISNICNVQCSFCPVVERDKEVLAPKDFHKILKQVKPIAQEICLHLMGEPLAHPKIEEILDICEQEGVQIQLTTNGLLLKKKQELILSHDCIRQVNFSLQAYQDNFPHKPLSDYMIPLLKFTELASNKREQMYINFRLWNVGSSLDNEEIYKLIEDYYKVEINRKVQVENIKSKRIWNRVYLHFDSRFDWPEMNQQVKSTQGRCHGLSSHIGIHTDGTVVPCCLDKEAVINLGNVLEQDLSSILEGDRASKMRIGFSNGQLVEDLCQRCDYIQRFNKQA
jgi:radical SAM protein with 4Fe4S-binding SPASM domain